MIRENYCRALGINPMKDIGADEALSIIDSREREWNASLQQRISGKVRHRTLERLRLVPDMRAVMTNPVLRKNEFEEGRKELSRIASHLLRCTVVSRDGKTQVIPSLASKLATAADWAGIGPDELIEASGIGSYKIPEPADRIVLDLYRLLSSAGMHTPYDFINHMLQIPGLGLDFEPISDSSPADSFFSDVDAIYNRREKPPMRNNPEGELYSEIAVMLRQIRTSKVLGDTVLYGRTMKELKPVMEIMDLDSGTVMTSEYIDGLLLSMMHEGTEDVDLAIRILERYCFVRGYPADFSGSHSSVSICPFCHGITSVGSGLSVCSLCGRNVRVRCPACGTVVSASDRMCRECGIGLEASEKEISDAVTGIPSMISSGLVEQALASVRGLRERYPFSGRLADAESDVSQMHGRLLSLRREVAECQKFGRPYALKTLVESSLNTFPNLADDPEIGPLYASAVDAVRRATDLCRGNAYGSTKDFIVAAEICPDLPMALSKLRTMVPEGPADGSAEDGDGGIVVRYAVPEDRRGMMFRIYRGTGTDPDTGPSAVPVAETENGVWLDTTAEPGVPYCYRIHSIRWGVMSEEYASAGPAVFVREVTDVAITQLEDGLGAEFVIPAGARRVRVWRKISGLPAGEGEEVEIPVGDGRFEDRGLQGDQAYAYLFVAEFDNGYRSRGTVFRGTTQPYPDPITDMDVTWDRTTGQYVAKWSAPVGAVLYRSPVHPEFQGRAQKLSDLDSWLQRIDAESSEGSQVFSLPPRHAHFIVPVIACGETGIVGDVAIVTNLRPLTQVQKHTEDGICTLTFPWPNGAVGVVVDGGDESVMIDRGEGETEGRVIVPLGSTQKRSVSLSAVYDIDGAKMSSISTSNDIWSSGSSVLDYELASRVTRNDHRKTEVLLNLHCPGCTSVPRMRMVMQQSGIPLRPNDGTVVWRSDDPLLLTGGSATYSFFIDREQADISRMRLFFEDRGAYSRYRVIHPIFRKG